LPNIAAEHKVIGKILGNRYRILREIGSGGMAWVYLAEDINEGRLVAIKILYPQFSEDITYIQRFNREAKLASTLFDQHIVRVLDYGASRDVHYLVMEYIEGQDLHSIIDQHGSLPWREVLNLIDQLATALEHAHLHGIVHRDIKPQNLMITSDGVLKVLDFGIARARMLPSLTQSGFVGSPYYISPEQAMGEEVDIRSDIYSAGVVLYQMLSGRVPYDAKSPWSIISQHIASEPPNINLSGSEIPETVELLMHRMVAKRPEDRFQTPTALREAIACVLEGRSLPDVIGTPPPAIPDRVATAKELYQRAQGAMQEEDWQRAVDLLNQVIKLDPNHTQASKELADAGRQARLDALYQAAHRAMEGGRWQEAMDELSEIILVQPNYRDAAALLDQTRTVQEKADLAQNVSSLYKEGSTHIEAGQWKDAVRCLRQVQQLSPGYKETQTLLAEAEHHLRSRSQRLAWVEAALRRVVPALALMLVLSGIVAGAYFLSQGDGALGAANPTAEPISTSGNLAQTYREAQTAFQAGDWDKTIELLDAVLTQDPNYQNADTLREQAEANRTLEELFNAGQTAYLASRWDEAIDALSRLRQTDATFRTTEVQDLLCSAYLQRGQDQMDSYIEASGDGLIEAALKDFEIGIAICPDNQALAVQQTYANSFLVALKAKALEDWNTVIRELTPVVTAEPDYANDNARNMLYHALVMRGNIRQQAGDRTDALSDYEQALALDETDPLGAASRRAEVLQGASGGTPATPRQTPSATPTYKYAAPTLISPENEVTFQGKFTPIVLEWEPVGRLAHNEYYDVTVMHHVGDEPRYWGDAVRETQRQVPPEAGFGEAGEDRFYWWVTIRKANTAPGPKQLDLALSPSSETRTFYWNE
jgi:serine/threonine protein kinase